MDTEWAYHSSETRRFQILPGAYPGIGQGGGGALLKIFFEGC